MFLKNCYFKIELNKSFGSRVWGGLIIFLNVFPGSFSTFWFFKPSVFGLKFDSIKKKERKTENFFFRAVFTYLE